MRWIIGAVILLAVAALLVAMARTWRSRARSQQDVAVPIAPPRTLSAPITDADGFYVATTRADEPLQRIVAHEWGFRGRGGLGVHDEGIVVRLVGRSERFIPATALRGADRATWAIDRVVEPGGLVRIRWTSDSHDVDTYFRFPDGGQDVLAAISTLAGGGTGTTSSTTTTSSSTRTGGSGTAGATGDTGEQTR